VGTMAAPNDSETDAGATAALERLVSDEAEAVVLLRPTATTCQARFVALDEATVTLAVYEPPGEVGADAVAWIHVASARAAFFAAVQRIEGSRLVVERPEALADLDQRRAFRVPVPPSAIAVSITFGPLSAEGWVEDISEIGAQITLCSTTARVVVGQPVTVVLQPCARSPLAFEGRVVRRTAQGCGLTIRPGPDGEPSPALVQLVRDAERAWLQRRPEEV